MPDADPETVDPQVTDAVTQANITVLGSSPAMAVGMLQQTTMHALTLSMQNATFALQQASIASQAAATLSASRLLQPAAPGGATDGRQ